MQSENRNNRKYYFYLIIVIILVFGLGFIAGRNQYKYYPPEDVDFSLFWEAYEKLYEKHVNSKNFDTQEMIYGAISGMVNSIDDPYSVFLNPEKSKRFLEDISGRFEGIGIEIGVRDEGLQVISPLEGTPAQKAGLKAGDKILKINDVFTFDLKIDDAVNLIRGQKGTEVILTVFREEWKDPKEIKIIRGTIEIPSLDLKFLETDGKNIAYLRIFQFSEKTSSDFQKKSLEIINSSAKGIILDLRNNPGGYLNVSQDIAGWFLEKGDTVVIEDFGEKGDQKIYESTGNARLLEYPIVILINQGSASAAEILAGALRDNRGITLIGEKTFGKGSIQELEKLSEGSRLKITIANWLTPNGNLITDKGLEPDIEVELISEEEDAQLEKALEVIKEII